MRQRLIFGLMVLFLTGSLMAAEEFHISDDVPVALRTGPSNGYRIKDWVTSGTMLEVLQRNAETGYVRIKDANGREGWVDGQRVDPGVSLAKRLPQLEEALTQARQQLETQGEHLQRLQADLKRSNQARAEVITEKERLQNEIDRLKATIAGMDESNLMAWFLRGGGVALAGLIIGLILPHLPKKRRRNDEWF